jgi:hypothetical protein
MSEKVTIDNDVSAAIITLLCHLPEKFQGFWWTVEEYCDMLMRSGLKDDVVWAFRPLLSGATKMTEATETFDASPSDSQWLDSHSLLFHLVLLIEGGDSQWNGRKRLSK